MPGIEDLTNIMMAGGRPDVPPPMGAPPMGAPPPEMVGGPPMEDPNAGMMGGMGAPPPPPEMVAAQQGGQDSENVNVEEDAAMLAETVIGRTGNIETAVAVLDTAKAMLMGGGDPMAQEQPMMANMGGPLYRQDGGTMSDTDLLRQMIMSGLQDRTMSNGGELKYKAAGGYMTQEDAMVDLMRHRSS